MQGCMQKFVRGGEFIGHYYGLTQHFILCAEALSTIDLPEVPTPFHAHHGIDQNPKVCLFSTWKEGKRTVKRSKNVTDFEQNTQTNPMSVRGGPAATRSIVVCNLISRYLLLDLES